MYDDGMADYPQCVEYCQVCGRIVLGLAGQDVVLKSYFLRRDNSDANSAEARISGPCHLRCLLNSGYGGFWASRVRDYYSIPHGARTVQSSPDTLACYSKFVKSVTVVKTDGWFLSVYAGSLSAFLLEENQHVIFRDVAEVHVPASAFPAGGLEPGEEIDFAALLKCLGILEDLYWKGIVDSVSMKPVEGGSAGTESDLLMSVEYPVRMHKMDYLLACAVSGRKLPRTM